jgi:hypothetical protein
MGKITVKVGSITGFSSFTQELTREVEFVSEELASRTVYGLSDKGYLTDTRGVTETLYKTEDGRLVVHVKDWSNWQGEPNVYSLVEVTEADLNVNGRFEDLGREAGYGRPLTLDEALEPPSESEPE